MMGKAREVVTAYSDAASAQTIREIARAESRSVAQVAGAALRFYALLSADVRQALRELEEDEPALQQLVEQMARVVRAQRFDTAAQKLAQSLPEGIEVPEDEEAILTLAVQAVKRMEADS